MLLFQKCLLFLLLLLFSVLINSSRRSPVQNCPKTRRYGRIQSQKCTGAVDPNLKPRVRLEKWFTRDIWENLFPIANQGWGEHPCMPYSFDAFIIAARYFPDFGAISNSSVGESSYTGDQLQRRDVAAFFAHVLAESGLNNLRLFKYLFEDSAFVRNSSSKLSPRAATECFYRGGFYHFFEGGPRSPLFAKRRDGNAFRDGERCVEEGHYCKRSPELDFWYPCKQFEDSSESANSSAFEGCYFGRGPLQLSWNYNYGQVSYATEPDSLAPFFRHCAVFRHFLRTEGIDVDLLQEPNQLLNRLDPPLAMLSALWFYNTPQPPKPSMHEIMTGEWNPSKRNRAAGYRGSVFGPTSLVINNECTGEDKNPDSFFPGLGGENRRIKAFKWFCDKLGVSAGPEETLSCKGMPEGFGLGKRLLSWQPDWANMWKRKPCDCMPASFAGVLPYFDVKHHPSRQWAKENERNRLRCVYSLYKKPELFRMNVDNSPCLAYSRSGSDCPPSSSASSSASHSPEHQHVAMAIARELFLDFWKTTVGGRNGLTVDEEDDDDLSEVGGTEGEEEAEPEMSPGGMCKTTTPEGDVMPKKEKVVVEKRHKCDVCRKAFPYFSILESHKRCHTALFVSFLRQTLRSESHVSCARTDTHRRKASSHAALYTNKNTQGAKVFQCQHCPKTFTHLKLLVKQLHEQNEHKQCCRFCSKSFAYAGSLQASGL
uniref:C2H2-type domain-containing protein n=1 Tax=Globodera rostochiensis TaxID=31243 RepID=A0A914H2Z3_GLORO